MLLIHHYTQTSKCWVLTNIYRKQNWTFDWKCGGIRESEKNRTYSPPSETRGPELMDSLGEQITLDEFVASVNTSESNVTMHHLENASASGVESGIGLSSSQGGVHVDGLSPSSTDTSIDKPTGIYAIFFFYLVLYAKFMKKTLVVHRFLRSIKTSRC